MSTPSSRRRTSRRHTRRLSQVRSLLRHTTSSSTASAPADVVDLDTNHNGMCIDLTTDDDEVIDLTSVNDSPVVVLSAIDADISGNRRSRSFRSRGRRRGHSISRRTTPRTQRLYQDSDSEDEDLPAFDTTGTPYRPSGEGSGVVTSPQHITITCPICMDDDKQIRRSGRQIMSTTCGHLFCDECIGQAIRAQHCCPTCRKRLTHRQTHPLFL
ncbi:E3 ubiquitin-protein ligase RNF4-like [Haliotis asinina]|uniref:E3 ubiquitin-protein ligase RNF4-like n=1 Tax=Haliotis asinina TaxID=109174 RepID=UPI0035322611